MAIRQLNIEGRTYYFYNDLKNKKNFNSNNLKLDKKSVLGNDVHYIRYITIISNYNGDIMQKYQEVFDGIKEIIKNINDYSQPIKYDDNYMKIKFNTDDNIPLNKIIYFPTITIIIRSVTQKYVKYDPQIFLDECFYQV